MTRLAATTSSRLFLLLPWIATHAFVTPIAHHNTQPISFSSSCSSATENRITKSEQEWKDLLTAEQYYVLREEGTEAPNTSQLNSIRHEETPGTFLCAGCGSPLFSSATKFDSGTGWPSFTAPVSQSSAVTLSTDFKLILPRTECSCATCGGHLGHVFDDGPSDSATGQRFCMNGVAMEFSEDPELALRLQNESDPYTVGIAQVVPTLLVNGIVSGLLLNSFWMRLQAGTPAIGILDVVLTLGPALYCGNLFVQAALRLQGAATDDKN